jgi:hypothetical protein
VLTVAAVLTATVTLLEQKRAPSPLKIESITLWKHRAGTTCTLIGVITTNGEPGSVAYGWTSEAGTGPVVTEPVGQGREQVEARFDWHAETAHTPDPVVSLQVLQPELKQVAAHPATDCG